MKVFGYEYDNDVLLKMEEISLQCDLGELKKIIIFLQDVYEKHSSVQMQTDICHSHLRDWDKMWKKGNPDIVIVTKSKTVDGSRPVKKSPKT